MVKTPAKCCTPKRRAILKPRPAQICEIVHTHCGNKHAFGRIFPAPGGLAAVTSMRQRMRSGAIRLRHRLGRGAALGHMRRSTRNVALAAIAFRLCVLKTSINTLRLSDQSGG